MTSSAPSRVLIVGSLLLAACASTPAPNADGSSTTPTATTTAVATTPPELPTPEQIDAGKQVFAKACGSCHDKEHHTYAFVRTLDDVKYTEDRLRKKIRQDPGPPGDSPQMPAISTDVLPDSDLPALIAYLRSIRAVVP